MDRPCLDSVVRARLCNGRYPYGNFIVMHPSRNIDGLQILEVPPGPDEQLVFFMQDEEFQELANTLKQNTTASVLLGENTIHTRYLCICRWTHPEAQRTKADVLQRQ